MRKKSSGRQLPETATLHPGQVPRKLAEGRDSQGAPYRFDAPVQSMEAPRRSANAEAQPRTETPVYVNITWPLTGTPKTVAG